MYHLTPSFIDIRTVLINILPSLSDEDIEIILDVFMTSL
jgi:hypothetical protein